MLKQMDRPTAEHLSAILTQAGSGRPVQPAWQAQRAPGSQIALDKNGRKTWQAFSGWTRMVLDQNKTGLVNMTHQVSLPDPWPRQRTFDQAWYLLHPLLNPLPENDQVWLCFDAVSHACVVFVNGEEAGHHIGGFTPFELNLTPWLQEGINTIAIWVQDDSAVLDTATSSAISQLATPHRGPAASHRPEMAGLTGGVYLERRSSLHLARIHIKPSTRKQQLCIVAHLSDQNPAGRIRHEVYHWPDGQTPVLTVPPVALSEGSTGPGLTTVRSEVEWTNPTLWSPESPHLYVLRTTVERKGTSESVETRFGFREFWIDGKHFMLNGHPIRLLGDGDVRFEFLSLDPERARDHNRRLLATLKHKFFFNAARLHTFLYPRWVVQAADEVGLLLIDQSAIWSHFKGHYTRGGQQFLENMRLQFAEWFYRDANNPSVVIWDVENEMIRDGRTPEEEKWVLQLDEFIKEHDPLAIINHSGAAYYHPQQAMIHVHMQEQYTRIMEEWQESGSRPLVMGEFWIGGRGETRLPNGYEYQDREDWHREEARLYREHMLQMRNYSVAGIMPHRITNWPLIKPPVLNSAATDDAPYTWRFDTVRAEGARGLAPVVVFAWPRRSTVVEDETFNREIVLCNDHETAQALFVTCQYGPHTREFSITLQPGEQHRWTVSFTPTKTTEDLVLTAKDAQSAHLEEDRLSIHALPAAATQPPICQRRLVLLTEGDKETAAALTELGLSYTVEATLPEDADKTIVIIPPGAPRCAVKGSATALGQYLAAGGRLLSLAQSQRPAWGPRGFLFSSTVRSSAPEFDQAGWQAENKDLLYCRALPTYAANHPALTYLEPHDFVEWGDDGRVADDAFVRPNAAELPAPCPYRVLLGHSRRENASLLEFRIGEGTGLLCQAHLIRQRQHPAARALLFNLLRYLDGPAWEARLEILGVLGTLPCSHVAQMTGLPESAIQDPRGCDCTPQLVLATDGANPEQIMKLAEAGATVLVLSCDTVGRLPGFEVQPAGESTLAGTRANTTDHQIFWGVASASFLPLDQSPAQGTLTALPAGATPLLQGLIRRDLSWRDIGFKGLETLDGAAPLAAELAVGKGRIIATTLEPRDPTKEAHCQLLVNLLANGGIRIPRGLQDGQVFQVKPTVPLSFDGRLDDWTNDMEDSNLSEYSHADPILLTAQDTIHGQVASDASFSAVLYWLYDSETLYLGGIIFSDKEEVLLSAYLDDQLIELALNTQTLRINGRPMDGTRLVLGQQAADEILDTRALNLSQVHWRTGQVTRCARFTGTTFESAIPWKAIGHETPPARMRSRICLTQASGAMLQVPVTTAPSSPRVELRLV